MLSQQVGLKFHSQSTCWLAGPVFHITYTELFSLRALGAVVPRPLTSCCLAQVSAPGMCLSSTYHRETLGSMCHTEYQKMAAPHSCRGNSGVIRVDL